MPVNVTAVNRSLVSAIVNPVEEGIISEVTFSDFIT